MQGKHVLITGGNTGIGEATARELARRGASVTITSRDEARGERAAERLRIATGAEVEVRPLDLGSLASIRRFSDEFLDAHRRLDVLINNAGVYLGDRRETADGFEATFGINHLGHVLLTDRLLPLLRATAPARVVIVASNAHRRTRGMTFDDLQRTRSYEALMVYSESKLANLLHCRALSRQLADTGVTVNAVHPGVVASGFAQDGDDRGVVGLWFRLGRLWMRTPEQGARASVYAATAPELAGITGRYFWDDGEREPYPPARDDAAAERLWRLSQEWLARGGPP